MKSIAIWYKEHVANGVAVESVELHFNFWKIPTNRKKFKRFLDIGVKLGQTQNIDFVSIYFPVILKEENIVDVVHQFINNNDLVCAIFNENYKTISQANSKLYKINNSKDEHVFDIYQLESSDFIIEQKYDGTIVNIKLPAVNNKVYFRIRVDATFCNALVAIQKPSNAFVQSAFSKIELTDFRVNDARDLNKSLLELIAKQKQLNIEKGHFFYMVSSSEDVLNYHAPFLSCRNLEKDKWDSYVGSHSIKKDDTILAYHWKEKGVTHFNILIKSKFESNNWKTIAIYLLFLGLISIIFNLLSSFIFESIKYFLKT